MLNLLIVEDETPLREGLRTMIDWTSIGIRVSGQAENGVKALACLEAGRIDILLSDIRMPGMDGLQLVQEIKQRQLDIACVLISGYNDFEYAQQAIRLGVKDFLSKPCSPNQVASAFRKVASRLYESRSLLQSMDQLQKNIPIAKSHVLLQWLRHPYKSTENRAEQMGQLNMSIGAEPIKVLAVTLDQNTFKQQHYNHQDMEILKFAAANIIQETLERGLRTPVEVLRDEKDILVVLNGDPKYASQKLADCLAEVQTNLIAYLKLTSSIGVSSTHKSVRQLHIAYREAVEARQVSFYKGTGKIYEYETIRHFHSGPQQSQADRDLIAMEHAIVEHLRAGLYAEALNETENWLRHFQDIHIQSRIRINIKTLSLLTRLIQFVQEQDLDSQNWTSGVYARLEQVDQIETMEELFGMVYGAMQQLIKLLNPQKTPRRKISQALAYIEAHYNSSDLSLTHVANDLFVSSTYLSTLFKQELGINFLDYVHQYRIEKAKAMLQTDNNKIQTVAKALGYFDEAHFTRTFKKWAGLLPSQYRKQAQNTQDHTSNIE